MDNRKAFTLIELLVVVLIIGILAAVAVPQYQKAVLKSRFVQLKTMAESIAKAEEVYYLANGVYTRQFENLDVETGGSNITQGINPGKQFDWGKCGLFIASEDSSSPNWASVSCYDLKNSIGYGKHFEWEGNVALRGKRVCLDLTKDSNSIQHRLCMEDAGTGTYVAGGNGTESFYEFYYER